MTIYSDADRVKETQEKLLRSPQQPTQYDTFTKKKGRSYTKRLALRLQLTRLKRLDNK